MTSNLYRGDSSVWTETQSVEVNDGLNPELTTASDVQLTILSSNLASGATVGEWGLSVFVEADGQCILFDVGNHPDTVIRNAEALTVDLGCVTDVVLSHHHSDHTGGLLPLLRKLRPDHPDAIQRVHVATDYFRSRRVPEFSGDAETNTMIAIRDSLEAAGIEIIEHSGPAEIMPGIWVTGPVQRIHDEKNYPDVVKIEMDGAWNEDFVPESQGLSIYTDQGHIVVLGCGHSGVVNMLEHVRSHIADEPVHALMGGLHLFNATDETLGWTADKLREIGVEHLMAGHCTGIEPLFRLRAGLNLSRKTAVVGAVGSRFILGEGIQPTAIAM
jgi:7,8-dihydropterin-6-yl-methyl-4-(beta-D-ribofuranosyl)aminobenzene 5'-phosphate synthase